MRPPSRETIRIAAFFGGLLVASFAVFGVAVALMAIAEAVTP